MNKNDSNIGSFSSTEFSTAALDSPTTKKHLSTWKVLLWITLVVWIGGSIVFTALIALPTIYVLGVLGMSCLFPVTVLIFWIGDTTNSPGQNSGQYWSDVYGWQDHPDKL